MRQPSAERTLFILILKLLRLKRRLGALGGLGAARTPIWINPNRKWWHIATYSTSAYDNILGYGRFYSEGAERVVGTANQTNR
jgi:hypothetical protein